MDFDLSEEQRVVRDAARRFIAERWSAAPVRAALDAPPVEIPPELWREIGALGWLGAAVSEAGGGSGQDLLTAALLAAEAGRGLLPGALGSALAAAIAVDRGGEPRLREAWLPDLTTGRRRATLAFEEPGGGWGPQSVCATAVAASGGGGTLSATKILVPDVPGADLLLVAARLNGQAALIAIDAGAPGVRIAPMRRLDAASIAEVTLDSTPYTAADVLGGPAGAALAESIYDLATVLLAADLLGTAEAALETTTRYARERVQFGRPIGAFQAVSHRLADVLVAIEIGRSLLYGACLAIEERRDEAPALVSAVKAWLSDTAVEATEAALQLHGGIGFTWDLDVHLYLRRARANAATLGDADHHRDRVAAHLERVLAAVPDHADARAAAPRAVSR